MIECCQCKRGFHENCLEAQSNNLCPEGYGCQRDSESSDETESEGKTAKDDTEGESEMAPLPEIQQSG